MFLNRRNIKEGAVTLLNSYRFFFILFTNVFGLDCYGLSTSRMVNIFQRFGFEIIIISPAVSGTPQNKEKLKNKFYLNFYTRYKGARIL